MPSFHELFARRAAELAAPSGGKALYFFKGFDLPQIEFLIGHPNSLLRDSRLIAGGHLDLKAVSDSWLSLAQTVQSASGPLVGFYEELLAIRDLLPRLDAGRITVIENNVLAPWQPSCLPYGDALALFDYLQTEQDPASDGLALLARCYSGVRLLDGEHALLLPVSPGEDVRVEPFWDEPSFSFGPGGGERIETGSTRDWLYRLRMLRDEHPPALFLQHGKRQDARQRALAGALRALGAGYAFDEADRYAEKVTYDEAPFMELLRRHWGQDAAFRPLQFYRDPDVSRETETVSQGQIIAQIVDQCRSAADRQPYSSVFITSPTGAGKSILFQIPALYLAEKLGLVTIVVSPLIALMNDQVDQLERERGISIAACVNSAMSMEDRLDAIGQIHAGKKSLLYLAPELLLTTRLRDFLGGREVGLLVIDEAHTVTTWGRDFRSDYWFLGDFIRRARRDGMEFPVLCLTATAVYSGENDVVNDTIRELGLERTIIHLGSVKRTNISFDITRHDRDRLTKKVESVKMDLVLTRTRQYVAAGEKVLTYFPYRSQVDQIHGMIGPGERVRIRRYHGQLPPPERKLVEKSYKSGEALGLFCTKAFGMGIDVGDIRHVVHFAPTGTLADYVQEIGRAARDTGIQGVAHIDYFPSDLRYVRALNGISEMRQYQLRELLKKLCAIYAAKRRRNLLISSETFEYLFREGEAENRTKTGLMLLAKDLDNRFSFPVLIVRPRAMLSKNYVFVPASVQDQFLARFGPYAAPQRGTGDRVIASRSQWGSDIKVSSDGGIYLVDMAAVWENCYPDMAFGMFKKQFFESRLRSRNDEYHLAPRVKAEIRYKDSYGAAAERLDAVICAMTEIFGRYKHAETKQFTARMFEDELKQALDGQAVAHDKLSLLLDIFTKSTDETAAYTRSRDQVRVLLKRKQAGTDETVYFVSSPAYAQLPGVFRQKMVQCAPNAGEDTFMRFYPLTQNSPIEIMPLLRVMELLELANYEIRGGEKAEVFIRINDPDRLSRLAQGGYTNGVLQAIQARHRNDQQLLAAFFMADMTTGERWDLIEQYFLGNEEYVRQALHMPPPD